MSVSVKPAPQEHGNRRGFTDELRLHGGPLRADLLSCSADLNQCPLSHKLPPPPSGGDGGEHQWVGYCAVTGMIAAHILHVPLKNLNLLHYIILLCEQHQCYHV